MQRQHGELVPIGDALSELGGPVKSIRETTPQARHHFTRADQVNQLVSASEADPERGFVGRDDGTLLIAPHQPRQPDSVQARQRPFHALHEHYGRQQTPYGNLPRLLMAWLSTEAVKTGSRVIVLGDSLSKFMRELGIYNSGGKPQTRLRNQMKRLFGCTVSMIYKDEHGEQFISSLIAESGEFWWNERKPDQPSLWNSKIELSEKFFNEIIRHPVPLDMNTLTALKRCSLGLDLYLWLVYRTFPLRAVQQITWKQMYRQFGLHPSKASDKKTVLNFRVKILREFKKIKLAWPELNYSTAPGVLILLPSVPTIPPVESSPRLAR